MRALDAFYTQPIRAPADREKFHNFLLKLILVFDLISHLITIHINHRVKNSAEQCLISEM